MKIARRRGDQDGRRAESARHFVERFALVMAASGFPRMPARVFAALLTADSGARTAGELAASLRISRAAVSGAVKYLEQANFLEREREPGARVDRYRVLADLWVQNMVRKDALLQAWERSLAEGVGVLGAATPAGLRLEETRRFFEFVRGEFPGIIARWQRLRAASR